MSDKKPVPTNSRKAAKFRAAKCLNCGHPLELSDRYCSFCSQLNTTKNLSVKDFFGEFLSSVITYDSRFRYTLRDLLFKPGVITRNYVAGQRLKYANPFRFFLSVSIIYFLLQSLITVFTSENNFIEENTKVKQNKGVQFGPSGDNIKFFTTEDDSLQIDSTKVDATSNVALDDLERVFRENNIQVNTTTLDSVILANNIEVDKEEYEAVMKQLDKIPFLRASKKEPSYELITEEALDTMSWAERHFNRFKLYYDFYETTEISEPAIALDSLGHKNTAYNRWAYGKTDSIDRVRKNPSEFLTYLLEKTPFFLFFFTPVFAFFFWLIYSKKKYTYMEHMIFIFHIFSFVFLAGIICLIPDTIIGDSIVFSIFLAFIGPFYFYKALRNFYKQNRLITIIKFIFLNWVFWIGTTITAVLFFTITAAMY